MEIAIAAVQQFVHDPAEEARLVGTKTV